jgi:excisionase family DNA binding protein
MLMFALWLCATLAATRPSPPSKYLSLNEAADMIGVHRDSIRNYISRGQLRGFKLPSSRLVVLRRADLERFVESNPIPTVEAS